MARKKVVAQIAMLALLGGVLLAFAAPPATAGAARPTAYFVHGLPGVKKVDICVKGEGEVVSRLPYGERVKRRFDAGSYGVKARVASKGACRGAVIARTGLGLGGGANKTVVLHTDAGDPHITKFDNDLSPTSPGDVRITAAHMMKGGPLDIYVADGVAIDRLPRGEIDTVDRSEGPFGMWATRAGKTDVLASRIVTNAADGSAFVFVLVGTKAANAQVVATRLSVGTT
jgi:hypothetical protein